MTSEESEIVRLLRAARAKARGHADFFGWPLDRDLEERQVVSTLDDSMALHGHRFFTDLVSRGRDNDPPDCEALTLENRRLAIEVTELVDASAIRAYKNGDVNYWSEWTKERFLGAVHQLLIGKDKRFLALKGAPYGGGYVCVIFTDEPSLPATMVSNYLSGRKFERIAHLSRAFLLLSYDPEQSGYPYFELTLVN